MNDLFIYEFKFFFKIGSRGIIQVSDPGDYNWGGMLGVRSTRRRDVGGKATRTVLLQRGDGILYQVDRPVGGRESGWSEPIEETGGGGKEVAKFQTC